MFKVDVEDQDGLGDLIALMAKQVQAEYRFRITLETESERLAGSVSKLVGSPLQVDPDLDETTGLGFGLLGLKPEVSGEGITLLGAFVKAEAEHKNGNPAKFYGTCEFCEKPRLARSKTCGGEECARLLNQKHQAAYQARKAAKAAQPDQEEVAASEVPFAGKSPLSSEPTYEVEYPDQTIRLNFQDLMEKNKSGEIPDGARIQAQPSGRWYVLSAGRLTPDGAAGQ